MMKKWVDCIVVASLTACACSVGPQIAGTSEQGNARVTASVFTSRSQPAAGALVTLRTQDYLGQTVTPLAKAFRVKAETVVGPNGVFVIDSLSAGAYSIEINDDTAHALLMRCTIVNNAQKLDLGTDTLRPYATVTGLVDSATATAHPLFVQVYGLERRVPVSPAGEFTLAGLPAGIFRLRIVSTDTVFKPVVIDSVAAASDSITVLPHSAWRYATWIFINTSATGAAVSENITSFPLLIRLVDTTYDFSRATGTGSDIRFTKADGKPLPFEIEQWDSGGADAAVWVQMDTVFGNNNTQYIILWSGSPSAPAASNGATVFGTAAHYKAVWHFSEGAAGTGTAGLYKDATGNGNDGDDFVSTTSQTGVIGKGCSLNGVNDYIPINHSITEIGRNSFTVEAWVQPNNNGGCVLYKGDSVSTWSSGGRMLFMGGGPANPLTDGTYPSIAGYGSGVATTIDSLKVPDYNHFALRWEYLGADSGIVSIFENGVLLPMANSTYKVPTADGAAAMVWIGRCPGLPGGGFFSGNIDELRISGVARSDSWIKLCYQSQRRALSIISFK